jgi:hypothetical protein
MNEPKKSSSAKVVLWIIGVGFGGLICCGVASAIAIPSFIGYTRRSKTAEVEHNLRTIFQGAAAYHQQEHFAGGTVITGQLPPAAPRTPPTPGCGTQQVGSFQHPSWQALGFTPYDPLYYAYEYVPGADGRSFVARAVGDLDCDSVLSTFELHAGINAAGELYREPGLRITNELE